MLLTILDGSAKIRPEPWPSFSIYDQVTVPWYFGLLMKPLWRHGCSWDSWVIQGMTHRVFSAATEHGDCVGAARVSSVLLKWAV